MKARKGLAVRVAVLAVAVGALTLSPAAWAADGPAEDLAVIDGHGSSRPAVVAKYTRALDRLHGKCPRDTRTHLADMAAVTTQQTHGKASALQALRGVYTSIPKRLAGKVKCSGQFAAYIILVNGGAKP